LETALGLFAERSYHGVSMRDIAGAVGIAVSSVYAHLDSKQQILFELALAGQEEYRDHMRRALLEAGSDPGEQTRLLVAAHVRVHATYPLLSRVCNREYSALEGSNLARVAGLLNESMQMMLDVITRGSEMGAFDISDPWLATTAIAAMGSRIADWWDDDRGYAIEDVVQTYSTYALRVLSRRADPIV
jgi:AcrR family transcriptional regulator